MTVPFAVQNIHDELAARGVWNQISKNVGQATSCREAAFVRRRLGAVGIPLWDELKSHVGSYNTTSGRQYVVVHCRAHQQRDDEKINALVEASVSKVGAAEIAEKFGVGYGRINPFFFSRHPDVLQIFDRTVTDQFPAPNTMMTNAGDLEWGIEFHPGDVISYLPNTQVAELVTVSSGIPWDEPILGILTGNGPESGIELWRRINAAVQANSELIFRGDTSYPMMEVVSLPGMGVSMELPIREADVRETVMEGIDRLCAAGATVVGIACNTTQYFSSEIHDHCKAAGAEFVSLVDAVRQELTIGSVEKFDLLGIGPVVDLQHWSDFRRLEDQFRIVLPTTRDVQRVTELAWDVKAKRDKTSGSSVAKLQQVLSTSTTTNTILIALTELSVVLAEHRKIATRLKADSDKEVVDSLTALANAMAARYVETRVRAISRNLDDPG